MSKQGPSLSQQAFKSIPKAQNQSRTDKGKAAADPFNMQEFQDHVVSMDLANHHHHPLAQTRAPDFELYIHGMERSERPMNAQDWHQEFKEPQHEVFEEVYGNTGPQQQHQHNHHQHNHQVGIYQPREFMGGYMGEFQRQFSGTGIMNGGETMHPQFYEYQMTETEWKKEFDQIKALEGSFISQEKDQNQNQTRDWKKDFEEIWKQSQENPVNREPGNWENQFKHLMESEYEGFEKYHDHDHDCNLDPVTMECPAYVFEENNPFLTSQNPFEEGLEILRNNGSLTLAALAFEAAVQKDPHNDLAWQRLGTVQAENEKEIPALAALQRCVQENPKNSEALMSLAVSYINEGQVHEAHSSLDRWLQNNYPDLQMKPYTKGEDCHERLTNYFLNQITKQATQDLQSMDPNLQIGLGLLYYNTQEYEKTIDCFTAALQVRPDDYLLWSRLGATLTNSGNNEGAIEAYHRALELNPGFVRGRYNLGVGCMNIGCHKEAAEHFLTALTLHVRPDQQQPMNEKSAHVSRTLWDTLHRNFLLMDRRDLAELVQEHNVDLFRKEFEF